MQHLKKKRCWPKRGPWCSRRFHPTIYTTYLRCLFWASRMTCEKIDCADRATEVQVWSFRKPAKVDILYYTLVEDTRSSCPASSRKGREKLSWYIQAMSFSRAQSNSFFRQVAPSRPDLGDVSNVPRHRAHCCICSKCIQRSVCSHLVLRNCLGRHLEQYFSLVTPCCLVAGCLI